MQCGDAGRITGSREDSELYLNGMVILLRSLWGARRHEMIRFKWRAVLACLGEALPLGFPSDAC